ncbi:MAG: hypothetical protein D6741_20500 [Planctomycetota bacterium]|nr:MAG: hypothetical protein D6741_20500 [Planctomycetota bacterium]
METSLHRQLKEQYAGARGRTEVTLGDYRVDVVRGKRLIEIQHGPLGVIRRKIAALLEEHSVTIVKPIVARKWLIKLTKKNGTVADVRRSPYRGSMLDVFEDLLHFMQVYPHRRLRLEVPFIDIEEYRYPRPKRRRRWSAPSHSVLDQRLIRVRETLTLETAGDLWAMIDADLPEPFHTRNLADALDIDRWKARRIAYCLFHAGAAERVGKRGNAYLYTRCALPRPRTRRRAEAVRAALEWPLPDVESISGRAAG